MLQLPRYAGKHVEGDLFDLRVGWAGTIEQKLEKLWPQVVSILVGQLTSNLGSQVSTFSGIGHNIL